MTLYICGLCERESEDHAAILAHMKSQHGIDNPSESEGIRLTPDSPAWYEAIEKDVLQPGLYELIA